MRKLRLALANARVGAARCTHSTVVADGTVIASVARFAGARAIDTRNVGRTRAIVGAAADSARYANPRARARACTVDALTMRAAVFRACLEIAVVTSVALNTGALACSGVTQPRFGAIVWTALFATRRALVRAAAHAGAVGAHTAAGALVVAVALWAHERRTVGVHVEAKARTVLAALARTVEALAVAEAVAAALLILTRHTLPADVAPANQLVTCSVLTAVIGTRTHRAVEAGPVGVARASPVFVADAVVGAIVRAQSVRAHHALPPRIAFALVGCIAERAMDAVLLVARLAAPPRFTRTIAVVAHPIAVARPRT